MFNVCFVCLFRNRVRFFKNHDHWLNSCTYFPPSTSTSRPKAGRPTTAEFNDNCERGKRKKTEHLRATTSTEELSYATQMKLRSSGHKKAADIVAAVSSRPESAEKVT